MRILAIGINYWPEQTGIGSYSTGRCEYLAAQGHEVAICTALPYYPQWRIAEGYRGRALVSEVRNGVRIKRTWLYVPARVTSGRRVLHEASFIAAASVRAAASRKPDLILVISPPLGLALVGVMLAAVWRVPYVFHVADLQPDAAVDLGMLGDGRLVRALFALERLAYRRARLVATLTEAMRRRIIAKGVPPAKVALCPDWTDPALFQLPLSGGGQDFVREHRMEGKFLVVHAGNMGVKQGLDTVLDAAKRARHLPDIVFLLVGDGAMREVLVKRAREEGLNNVVFLCLLEKAGFFDLLAASAVCLVTQQKVVADIVFPSKVLTLFAAGRPVIASVNEGSEVARVIGEGNAGERVEAENPEALLAAIVKLRDDAARRLYLGANARRYARDHWSHEQVLPAFERQLVELLAGNSTVTAGHPSGESPRRPVG